MYNFGRVFAVETSHKSYKKLHKSYQVLHNNFSLHHLNTTTKGSFNNYVDKMRGEGVKNCLFLSMLRV